MANVSSVLIKVKAKGLIYPEGWIVEAQKLGVVRQEYRGDMWESPVKAGETK